MICDRCIPISEFEFEKLRKLVLILTKYLSPEMLDPIYEIIENYFGGLFSKKFMFFIGEFSDENDLEDMDENEDIVSTIANFSLYSYSHKCINELNFTQLNLYNVVKSSVKSFIYNFFLILT